MAEITAEQLYILNYVKTARDRFCRDGYPSLVQAIDHLILSEKPKECRPPENEPGWYWVHSAIDRKEQVMQFIYEKWYAVGFTDGLSSRQAYTNGWKVTRPCL